MPWCSEARGNLRGSFHLHRQRVLGIRQPVHNRGKGTLLAPSSLPHPKHPGSRCLADGQEVGALPVSHDFLYGAEGIAFIQFLSRVIITWSFCLYLPRTGMIASCFADVGVTKFQSWSHIAELGLEANTDWLQTPCFSLQSSSRGGGN